MKTFVAALAALTVMAGASRAESPTHPDWLVGFWLSCEGGVQTSEVWIGGGGGLLVGANHTRRANGRTAFEHMRVGPGAGGKLAFFGSPGGAPAVEFPLVRQTATSATFENAAHDFPQRVVYRREGDVLIGRIEGTEGGAERAFEWRFQRTAEVGAACPRSAR